MHNFCNLTLNVVVLQTVVYVHEYVYRDFVKDNDCTKVGVTDWCIRFFNPNTHMYITEARIKRIIKAI